MVFSDSLMNSVFPILAFDFWEFGTRNLIQTWYLGPKRTNSKSELMTFEFWFILVTLVFYPHDLMIYFISIFLMNIKDMLICWIDNIVKMLFH